MKDASAGLRYGCVRTTNRCHLGCPLGFTLIGNFPSIVVQLRGIQVLSVRAFALCKTPSSFIRLSTARDCFIVLQVGDVCCESNP